MKNERMDQILRQALAPEIPDEGLNRNLKKKMEESGMEHSKVKHFGIKKAVILAAACCFLIGTVGVASSGKIASLVSGFYHKDFKSFNQLTEAEASAGFSIKATESFQNGYTFSDMCVYDTKGLDEDGNVLENYKQIDIDYKKAGEAELHFSAMKETYAHEDVRTPLQTVGINGVEVKYYVDTYKNVPVGYELTPEDEENLKRTDYQISVGADEISVGLHSDVVWYQDGIRYCILNINGATPAEVLFGMAEELITT